MNFAFPALLVFLLTLPGLILRYTYSRGFFREHSPVSFRSMADEIGYSITISVALHTLWYFGASQLGYVPDLQSVLTLLTGLYGTNNEYFDRAIQSFSAFPLQVSSYFLTLYGFSGITGYVMHYGVRALHLDWKFVAVRFRNEWFYLLTGEVLNFHENNPAQEYTVDGTYASVVVEQGGRSYLYRGREITKDRAGRKRHPPLQDPRYYNIEGDFFLIRYADIRTMNLEYLLLIEETAS